MPPSTILSERDTNIKQQPITPSEGQDQAEKPKSMEYHRQVLESRLKEGKNQTTYISPSDTIMSPATQKLAAFKNKHIKAAKPQSLFAKTASKNVDAAQAGGKGGGDMFADIPRSEKKEDVVGS